MFRDGFEKCPRCGVELVDARSARTCRTCGGMWVEEAVLEEMVLEMLPPGPLKRLQLAVMNRSEAPIACPSCHEAMQPTEIHDVILDRCPKHGVWFDKDELGTALLRVGVRDAAQPLVETAGRGLIRPEAVALPQLTFQIATPGKMVRVVELRQGIIKIGQMTNSDVHVKDPRVAHMHTLIEVTPTEAVLIDLGSSDGTQVNGVRVKTRRLASGDRLLLGATTIELTIS